MARLVTAFQLGELKLPSWETWLKNELESFEFTYTATGVRYEAPKGEHDDGVIALALALHGWDRVQCVVPEEAPLLPLVGDDRYFPADGEILAPGVSGDFMSQLPGGF
jgi:hypothetical protein